MAIFQSPHLGLRIQNSIGFDVPVFSMFLYNGMPKRREISSVYIHLFSPLAISQTDNHPFFNEFMYLYHCFATKCIPDFDAKFIIQPEHIRANASVGIASNINDKCWSLQTHACISSTTATVTTS